MSEDLYPLSPTALNMSQRRTQRIRGHRYKILKASGASDLVPDEIPLSARSSPNPNEHKLFRADDDSNDGDAIENSQPDPKNASFLDAAATPNLKRFKAETAEDDESQVCQIQKRRLNYESDDSVRHSILDSDSSNEESPFFHFCEDKRDDVNKKAQLPSLEKAQLDLSMNSKLVESLNELSQFFASQNKEADDEDEEERKFTQILMDVNKAEHLDEEDDDKEVQDEIQSTEFQIPASQAIRKGPDHNYNEESPPPAEEGLCPSEFNEDNAAEAHQIDLFGDSQCADDIDSLLKSAADEFSQRRKADPPAGGSREAKISLQPYYQQDLQQAKIWERQLERDDPKSSMEPNIQTNHPTPSEIPQFVGFTTAGGKNCHKWSEEDLKQQEIWKKQLEQELPKSSSQHETEPTQRKRAHPGSSDFPPSGEPFKRAKLSGEDLKQAKEWENQLKKSQTETQNDCPPPFEIPQFVGFTTGGGKNRYKLSNDDLKQAKEWEKQLEKGVPKFYTEEKSRDDEGLSVAYLEKLHAIEKGRKVEFASPRVVEFASPRLPKFKAKMSTPIAKPRSKEPTYSQEISAAVNAVMQDSEFLDEQLFFRGISEDSFGKTFGSQAAFSPIAKPSGRSKSQRIFTQIDNSRRNMLKFQVTEEMKEQSRDLIASLQRNEKTGESCKPFKSEFIEKKLTTGKVQLTEVFGRKLVPGVLPSGLEMQNLKMDVLLDYKFDALIFFSNDQIREGFSKGIPLDHFTVPLTETFYIGSKELELAFFSANGIDPKLISRAWFINAYRLVIWKLLSMEVYSPSESKGEWLTPGNVLNELHYRYYMEIDRSKQSILKNCLEMDDNPGYLMVLFVMDIVENVLILSDGHYSVKTRIDDCLEEQLEKGRIWRGMKLIVDSAEFTGLDQGYAPLEVPDFVFLKIFGNSTRRCRWDTKLGRFFKRTQLKVSLNSVHPKGGLISAVNLIVIRKYPLLFVSGNRHRNERMQRKYRKELQTRHFNLYEKLYHQLELELAEEERERRETLDWKKLENIKELTDMNELHDLLQASRDPQYLEEQLSREQKRRLEEFKQKLMVERSEKVHQRIKEKMDEDMSNESVLLRVKVAAGLADTDRCAELWIWNPDEELGQRILTEGKVIKMEKIIATGMRNNILQLKTGRRTIIKELSNKNLTSTTSALQRSFIKLADIGSIREYSPMFGEFDTVAIILKISRRVSEKFQYVFATDNQTNLICLNFWNGLQEFSYEDLVRPGKVISFSNLQWRKNSNTLGIPNGYVTELSVLTMSPGHSRHVEEMASYAEFVEECGLNEIEENVRARYPFFKDIKSENVSSVNLNGSLQRSANCHQSPIIKTPVAKTRQKGMTTPGQSAMQTPLIERQINLLNRR